MADVPPADEGPTQAQDGAVVDWAAALDEHRCWLRSVVLARVGELHAVDDVLQEVALAAVRHGPRLREADNIAPWLYRVAVRQALVYRRKTGRRRRRYEQLRERARAEHPLAPDPLQWLLAMERQTLVRTALERLSDRDAEILLLKYAQDCSYRQIASYLGISESAVETRLHRARQKLRQTLARHMEHVEE